MINNKWDIVLQDEFKKEYFRNLGIFVKDEYNHKIIYPEYKDIFNALRYTDYDQVKVVILGQDPYHGEKEAHGLSFSVRQGVPMPPSLRNIFKELKNDIGVDRNLTDLTDWAKQGVLLLNSVLTVEKNKPNSHKNKGWEQITGKVVELLNQRVDPVIFLLWGSNAKAIGKNIDRNKHYVLEAVHPSPMSANQGGWFGCHHFSKTNEILRKLNKTPIDWQIENI